MSGGEAAGGDNPTRARDHMANERTYLAWVRTATSVMVVGLAVAKFADNGQSRALVAGLLLVVVGALGVVQGSVRYVRVNRELERGRFDAGSSARDPMIASVVLVVAMVVAFLILEV